ncbi:MAG TPA: M48 family metalloprotease [Chitinophagaceae bacterium]|nr:M48 family metalloprotease [Chitinophagaceae bacterium]
MKKLLLLTSLSASLFLLDSCARNPVSGKRQVVLMSEEQEIAMGKEADPQIIAQFGLYEDKQLQDYITQHGKALAAVSHRPNLDYQFRIVESEVLNAFAVPGGYIYFTRGIMAHFNNEAEFIGVLGHELGHVAARHSVVQQRNQLLGQLGLIAGIVVAPELAQFADAASQGLGLMFLKFGRDDERESDRLGVEYSSKLGYDAKEMADFFTVLQRQGEASGAGELPNFLSTHPNPGERNKTVAQLAAQWKQQLNLTNAKVNRETYLRRIEGLVYGEDPKGGFLENNVFYHPVMKFQFPVPSGWSYQNSPTRVQIAPNDGKALLFLTLGQGSSLQQAAQTAMQQFQLQVVESRETSVNGLPAMAVVADQIQQNGAALRTLSYFIQHGGSIYHMIGVSSRTDFNNYANAFTGVMQGFRNLTDPAKLNKQPERIRIKTVGSGGTLQQVLRSFNVPDRRHEEHALLNGMLLADKVAGGTLIKIVQ